MILFVDLKNFSDFRILNKFEITVNTLFFYYLFLESLNWFRFRW